MQDNGLPRHFHFPAGPGPLIVKDLVRAFEAAHVIEKVRASKRCHVDLVRQADQERQIGQADPAAAGDHEVRRELSGVEQVRFPVSPHHLLYRKEMLRRGQLQKVSIPVNEKGAEFLVEIPDDPVTRDTPLLPEILFQVKTSAEFVKLFRRDPHVIL